MIQLGQKVKDAVTGYTGFVTARTEFLNGCVRLSVQARPKKGNSVPSVEVFDQEQLEVLDEKPIRLPVARQAAALAVVAGERRQRTGGDRPDVSRRTDAGAERPDPARR